MNGSSLPTDIQELGELVISGEMTPQQMDEFLEKHSHYAFQCDEVCKLIFESFEDYPLRLLLEHNFESMTMEQCRFLHENLEDHVGPDDQGTRANLAMARLELSVGRGILSLVAEDLARWLDEESIDKFFSNEEILEKTREHLFALTSHEECTRETLEEFVSAYHEPGDWRDGGPNCEGPREDCDTCQEMLQAAFSRLA